MSPTLPTLTFALAFGCASLPPPAPAAVSASPAPSASPSAPVPAPATTATAAPASISSAAAATSLAAPASPAAAAPASLSSAAAAPALPQGVVSLEVPGFDAAVVSFPSAARTAPVLVVTHGAGDTPGALCDVWRGVLGDRGVLLCPAGPRIAWNAEGRYYPDHLALERIVLASIDALGKAFPGSVDLARITYAGYSQGAMMGALMIAAHGKEFPYLALVEGGFNEWSVVRAAAFREGGGRRVLFACGRQACKEAAERAAAWLRRAGVEARVVSSVGAGHTYGGGVARAVHGAFGWLVADDPRW